MPRRSRYDHLPESVRQQLDDHLSHPRPDYGFLVTWLASMDIVVTSGTLRQWHKRLEKAKELRVSVSPSVVNESHSSLLGDPLSDSGTDLLHQTPTDPMIDSALRSTIHTLHKATLKVQEDPSPSEVMLLSRAMRGLVQALADLQKLRGNTNEQARHAAAQEVSKTAQKVGLSDEIRQLIERDILGLQR